jgi:ligand-binding sensor domain-containing protein/HPt (histidine-containing phosphotransfer) domain-containing protein
VYPKSILYQKKYFFYIILIFNILFSSSHATRLYKPVIEDPLLEQWRWVKFPELSSKGVQCMVEDNNQTVWFGLDKGVISYDGSEWKEYNYSNGFTNGTVRVLSLSENGFLYAGSDSGLFVLSGNEWKLLFSTKNISGLIIESIIDIPQKGILCGTNYGLIRIQNDEFYIYTSKSQVDIFNDSNFNVIDVQDNVTVNNTFHIAHVYKDRQDNIWLAIGFNNGLSGKVIQTHFADESKSDLDFSVLYSENPKAQFYNGARILQTIDNRIWIINNQHDQGILYFENNKFHTFFLGKEFGADEITTSIIQAKDGTLFIGAMGILYTYKDDKWEIYRSPNIPLPSSTRILIYESKDGNLWIAGKRNEVYKFDYSTTNWVTYRYLNFEAESNDGTQWFVTTDGRVARHLEDKWISYGVEDGLIDAPVRVIVTRSGDVWAAGSHRGIAASAYLQGIKWTKQLYPELSWNIDSRGVFEDRDGSIWFGGNVDIQVAKGQKGGTVLIKNPDQDKTTFIQNITNQKEPSVYGMGQSKDGKMWLTGIGTCVLDSGIWKMVPTPEELKYHADYMCSSEDGHLWIGSRNYGLFHHDGNEWHRYTIEDGLASNSITYILPESETCTWIATDKGISKFDGESWSNNVFPSRLTIIREGGSIRKSSQGDIWINKRTREWTRRVLSQDKQLTDKMREFWTVFYKPDAQAPHTKIAIYDQQVYQPGNTIISWEGFDPWAKTPIEKLQFSYRMDGGKWSPYSYKTNNIFLSLRAGDHVFEVRCRDIDYNVDPEPAKVEFNVAPPFYLQPLFYIPMIILTIIIIALQIRIVIRGRKLRAAKRETDNILNNVKEGLLLINKNYTVGSQYSKILEKLLNEQEIAQKNFIELLQGKIDEKLLKSTADFIDILYRDSFDQDMMDELNPLSEAKLNFYDENEIKYLTFNFRNIETDKHDEREIMITIRDITEQTILEQKLKESQEEAKRQMDSLVGILHIDPPMLREFIVSASEELEYVESLLQIDKMVKLNNETLKDIYRSIHSIKGNASLLAFKVFAEQAHHFEDKISELEEKETLQKSDLNVLKSELDKIKKLLNEVNGLLDRIGKIHEQMRPKRSYEREVLLNSLTNLVNQTAKDEGKKAKLDTSKFKIEEIPHKDRIFVKEIMIQLLRNSIAHGIESPKERKDKKKAEEAKIMISTFTDKSHYGFILRDDGRGIQLDKLKQKVVKKMKTSEDEIKNWDNDQIINMIFEQGITTADEANMVSGRGVGLDIVNQKVGSRKGDIKVSFEEDKFCEFKISIPQAIEE